MFGLKDFETKITSDAHGSTRARRRPVFLDEGYSAILVFLLTLLSSLAEPATRQILANNYDSLGLGNGRPWKD